MADTAPKATIRNVAALAGVSVAAVSRFVNQKQHFTPEVEARIARAIAQLGYRTHPAARSMATGRSGAVAALVAGVDNPHAAALVKGLCRVAMAEGFDVLFVDTMHSASPQAELDRVMGMQVDGIVIAAPMPFGTGELLARYGRPFIDLARRPGAGAHAAGPPETAAPSAHEAAGALIGRYLLRSGHRCITFIACAAEAGNAERQRGLQQALAAAGVLLTVRHASAPTADGGAAAASGVLLAAQRPDAVVACNDQVAMGLLSEARLLGVSVPADVSVAGIENAPFGRYLSPALTSVELHADVLGAQAMTRLLAAIRGEPEPAAPPLPEPRLVIRDSTARRAG
jgi:DNA-binding LacI/PurR family transcriptional regulator